MALTEIYVDPSLAADSGTGTIGDPYGDLEYAIEQETFDTTNGTRVNIKAGTAEVLAANLETALANTVTSVAWVPTQAAPLVIQGYTSAAGDGGIGEISGNDAVQIISTSRDYVALIDLKLTNGVNGQYIVNLDQSSAVINCEIQCAGAGTAVGIFTNEYCTIIGNHIADAGQAAIRTDTSYVSGNYIVGNSGLYGIFGEKACTIERNIISVGSGLDGIILTGFNNHVVNNSIYSSGGTGSGIKNTTSGYVGSVLNNLIEGFSGTGGIGVEIDTGRGLYAYGGNAVYDCATAYSIAGLGWNPVYSFGDNETLTASPFADAANGDFSPVDIGNVKEGSLPSAFPTV